MRVGSQAAYLGCKPSSLTIWTHLDLAAVNFGSNRQPRVVSDALKHGGSISWKLPLNITAPLPLPSERNVCMTLAGLVPSAPRGGPCPVIRSVARHYLPRNNSRRVLLRGRVAATAIQRIADPTALLFIIFVGFRRLALFVAGRKRIGRKVACSICRRYDFLKLARYCGEYSRTHAPILCLCCGIEN